MTIAVSAASGLLGRSVLPLIAAANRNATVALVRNPENFSLPGIEVRQGDYANPDQLSRSLQGIDTLLLISAPIVRGTDRLALHRNAIRAAAEAGVRKIVYTSVIGADATPDMLYFPTQQIGRQTEQLVRESGMQWIIARSGFYLDLDLNHIRRADIETGVYRNNAETGRCGYISVDTLAIALARLITTDDHNNQFVNLCGECVTQQQLVDVTNDVFDLNVRYESCSAVECMANFMRLPSYAARGEDVVRMLAGCFECIAAGLFDVKSDYQRVTGQPPATLRQQMELIRLSNSAGSDYRTA